MGVEEEALETVEEKERRENIRLVDNATTTTAIIIITITTIIMMYRSVYRSGFGTCFYRKIR